MLTIHVAHWGGSAAGGIKGSAIGLVLFLCTLAMLLFYLSRILLSVVVCHFASSFSFGLVSESCRFDALLSVF